MSEWITNRPPKLEEATNEGDVWVYDIEADEYYIRNYEEVIKGQPWVEIPPPKPYVKPKRYKIVQLDNAEWAILRIADDKYVAYGIAWHAREAAERIEAIYEEVMP